MATEIASAYVSLIPSFKGGKAAIAGQLGAPVEQAGAEAGDKAGKAGSKSFGSSMAAGAKALGGGLAIFGGINLVKDAFQLSIDQANLPNQLKTQFGLAAPYAQEAAAAAGKLYADGWGESLNQVGESVGVVARAVNELGSGDDLGQATKQAEALAKTFGEEVGPLVNAASQMVKTGLADNLDQAFDIMTKGFQSGANASDDFLDTLTEYSSQFQKLGIDGTMATGLLNQGLGAGARNADLVADAIKEFSIRAVDGSKLTAEGFKAIGLNADQTAAAIGKGGTSAEQAFARTLDGIRSIKDPVKQSQAAVALFGTQAEDLGKSLYALNPATVATTGGMENVAGAANQVAGQVGSGLDMQLQQLSRTFEGGLASALTGILPLLSGLMSFLQPLLPVLAPMAIAIGLITAATWLWNAALDANPVSLLVLAIAGLVLGIIALWNKSAAFRDFWIGLWDGIKSVVGAVVDWLVVAFNNTIDWIKTAWSSIGSFFSGLWNGIKGVFGTVVNWIRQRWEDVLSFFRGIPGAIRSAFSTVADIITWPFRTAFNAVARLWNSTVGGFSFSIPDWVPLVGGKSFSIPNIPMLASGGVVDNPTLAMIGEAGPEAVMPLSKLNTMLSATAGDAGDSETAVYVYLDGEPVRNIAKTEIRKNDRDTTRAVRQGTGKLR